MSACQSRELSPATNSWKYIVDKQTGSKETAASDLWFYVVMETLRRRHTGKRQDVTQSETTASRGAVQSIEAWYQRPDLFQLK